MKVGYNNKDWHYYSLVYEAYVKKHNEGEVDITEGSVLYIPKSERERRSTLKLRSTYSHKDREVIDVEHPTYIVEGQHSESSTGNSGA